MARKAKLPRLENGPSVYLITTGRATKVGYSSNAHRRVRALATATAENIEVAHTWQFPDEETARRHESTLYRMFRWARANREWFTADPLHIRSVGDLLAEGRTTEAESLVYMLEQMAATEGERQVAWTVEALKAGLIPIEWDEVFFADRETFIREVPRAALAFTNP